jgi:hypothetical protein
LQEAPESGQKKPAKVAAKSPQNWMQEAKQLPEEAPKSSRKKRRIPLEKS